MADFSALKTSIQNYIKENGNEEITGNLLQQILLSMVTTLGDSAINDLVTALNAEIANRGNADTTLQGNINSEAAARGNADTELGGRITTLQGVVNGIKANVENGYVYAGIATPSTTPASGKVFYLALTAGTYTNFGATVVQQGINILKYNGSAWSLDSFLGLDDAPTQGSGHLVKSGGVLDSIIKDGSAFDLSAYNNGTTYADLSAALTALNALPAVYKKGGMSVKYVQTSDNKYVQYRLMATSFSTTKSDWQGVSSEVKADSKDLIDSGAVFDALFKEVEISNNDYVINSSGYYDKAALGVTLNKDKKYHVVMTALSSCDISSSAFIQFSSKQNVENEIKVTTTGIVESDTVILDRELIPTVDLVNIRIGLYSGAANTSVNVVITEESVEKYATKEEVNELENSTNERLDEIEEKISEDITISDENYSINASGYYDKTALGATLYAGKAYHVRMIMLTNKALVYPNNFIQFSSANNVENEIKVTTESPFEYVSANTVILDRILVPTVDLVNIRIKCTANSSVEVVITEEIEKFATKEETEILNADIQNLDIKTTHLAKKVSDGFLITEDEWTFENGGISTTGMRIYHEGETNAGVATSSGNADYIIPTFIPVEVGDEFIGCYCTAIFKYSEAKNETSAFIGNTPYDKTIAKVKRTRYVVSQADWNAGVRFIRAEFWDIGYGNVGLTKVAKGDYKIICLGDSIFGKIVKPFDQASWIQKICGLKTGNCGFGGTTVSYHSLSEDDLYNRLNLYNLADCIATGDFTSIDIDWGQTSDHDYDFNPQVDILKNVDYSKLKAIILAYDDNDWQFGRQIDNENNKYDKTTYCGAMRYSIERILGAYPNIQIVLLSAIMRFRKEEQPAGSGIYVVVETSDTMVNGNGKHIYDFVEALKGVADEYKLPFFDNYKNWGINRYNEAYYIGDNPIDGTHYKMKVGGEFYGRKAAKEIESAIGY